MVYRLIAPDWLREQGVASTLEGEFTDEQITEYNIQGYNVYYFPNGPSLYTGGHHVNSSDIDLFTCVFVDMDLKSGVYSSKDSFIEKIRSTHIKPTKIVDSGNGVHVYWNVSDLDAMSFLRFQKRLIRLFNTDEAVAKICQLMRVPGTLNNKILGEPKLCAIIEDSKKTYTAEELDKLLPPITVTDDQYCQQHYNKSFKINQLTEVDDVIPLKFLELLKENKEVSDIWKGNVKDRSAADFRLGHIMNAFGFTKDEALSVLVNSSKASQRLPQHRISYAQGIVDKIWVFAKAEETVSRLSSTVREILMKGGEDLKGTRFACSSYIDDTENGFRLGHVLGLIAGSGVGKTAMALNMFMGFVQNNPEYDHFYIPLEQPTNEIAERWENMCGDNTHLHDKVHVISNYADDGSFRHLSFSEIRDYLLQFKRETGKKIGCVVIDHIGALRKQGKNGENQDLMTICHEMKAFAINTNTFLVMQSQAPREKAGIGDLQLDKDAAYGTMYFEAYCDYVMTLWQPLKRVYDRPDCPIVTAFKFCKIRHKKVNTDVIKEDKVYKVRFDPKDERFHQFTEKEEKSFNFFLNQAITRRKADKKTEVIAYNSVNPLIGAKNGKTDSNKNAPTAKSA